MKEFTLITGNLGWSGATSADAYEVLVRQVAPGAVEVQLLVDGRVYGKLPLANILAAAVRVEPEVASAADRQVERLQAENRRLHDRLLEADVEKHRQPSQEEMTLLRGALVALADVFEVTCADALRKVAAGKAKGIIGKVLTAGMRRAKQARDLVAAPVSKGLKE